MSASFDRALIFLQSAKYLITPDLENASENAELARAINENYVIALYRCFVMSRLAHNSNARYSEALEMCKNFYTKTISNKETDLQFVLHECRILTYMGKNLENVTRGLQALSWVGIQIPPVLDNPSLVPSYEAELLQEVHKTTKDIGLLETFNNLPPLDNKMLFAAHSILIEIIAPMAWCAPYLLHTLPLVGVIMTFKHGKSVHSGFYVLSHTISC